MTSESKTGWTRRWLLNTAIIFFILVGGAGAAYAYYEYCYADRIYPGLTLNGVDLGGMTKAQLADLLDDKINQINQKGISFIYGGRPATIFPTVASNDAELAYNIIGFDAAKTADLAMSYGRSGNFVKKLQDKIGLILATKNLPVAFSLNGQEVANLLISNFSQYDTPHQDAKLIYSAYKNGLEDWFEISEEKAGSTIDYEIAVDQLSKNLAQFDLTAINLKPADRVPLILKKDVFDINIKAKKILAAAPLTLKAGDKSWPIEKSRLGIWLTLKQNANPTGPEDKIIIGIDKAEMEKFFVEKINPEVEMLPKEPKFVMKDGKVSEFQAGEDGRTVDLDTTITRIEKDFIASTSKEVEIAIAVTPAKSYGQENGFGVKELIGVGKSNFAGSPKNRRHNIKNGADTLNGILIKPDEVFSLMKTLGPIEASTGYLTELVIKGNKTIPEFGGGLCQIGTTMFRGALATGLPIVERRNHSYRVQYYEPAGTDATIYDPSPDLKFTNDTGNYILIQSRINKDELSFEFWGINDGRVATQTKPVISKIVKPGPAKLIETTDLAVGVKKCTEKAHNGADAYFDYSVTYPDGRLAEKRFSSHYIPWREVCLIGVEKLSDTPATSTPPTTP